MTNSFKHKCEDMDGELIHIKKLGVYACHIPDENMAITETGGVIPLKRSERKRR